MNLTSRVQRRGRARRRGTMPLPIPFSPLLQDSKADGEALFGALLFGGVHPGLGQPVASAGFIASLTSGSLAGVGFPVFFSYNPAEVASQGDSFVNLQAFNFTFQGVAFSKSDITQGGQVIFHNGKIQNLTVSLQGVLPTQSPVHNITFGFGGNGVIGYIDTQGGFGTGLFQFAAASAVLNAASFAVGQVSPGSLATLFGSALALQKNQAGSVPLLTSLGEVSVTVAGAPAPLLYVSPSQINFQVPWEASASTADVTVTLAGKPLTSLQVSIVPSSPGIFTVPFGGGQAVAINLDGSLAAPQGMFDVASHPARPGDYVMLLATGLGAVTPPIASGTPATDRLHQSVIVPRVSIGGQPAQVTFSGLAPQFVGVNQINVIVPDVSAGIVPVQIDIGDLRTSSQATIAVAAR